MPLLSNESRFTGKQRVKGLVSSNNNLCYSGQ